MNKQHGFALLGLLLSVVVIAALAYGSVFFWQKSRAQTSLETYDQAQKQIDNIKKIVDERNEKLTDQINEAPAGPDTSSWQIYEKEDFNIKLKFHKDWYWQRENRASEWGYKLYLGFAPSPSALAKGRPYPIEAVIFTSEPEEKGLSYYEKRQIRENDTVSIRSSMLDNEEIRKIVDEMYASLEKIIN